MLDRLGLGVMEDFNQLKAETQTKNIVAWTPVVTEVLNGFVYFDDQAVSLSARVTPKRLLTLPTILSL